MKKYYIADHGIREAVFGGNMRDINLILENIIYMELLRRGYTVTVGKEGNKEVDFVCDKRGERIYIQVTYLLASPGKPFSVNLACMITFETIFQSMSYLSMNLI